MAVSLADFIGSDNADLWFKVFVDVTAVVGLVWLWKPSAQAKLKLMLSRSPFPLPAKTS